MPQPRQDGASPSTPLLQGSFTAGELAPALYARTDLNKFHSGAKYIRNFFVQATGGLLNRSGTLFVGFVPGGNGVRLIPFSFNTEQTYVLVLTNEAIYFVSEGGFIENGGSYFSVATPYQASDLFEITYCQSADVLTLCHPNYPPAQVNRLAIGTFTYTPITVGTELVGPQITLIHGDNEGWPDQDAALAHQTVSFTYSITSCRLSPPDESALGNSAVTTNYDLSWNAYGVKNDIWFVPRGGERADYYNVYRYLYGTWGFCASTQGALATGGTGSIGGTLALVWNDRGVTPDTNTTPPQYINPFYTAAFDGSITGSLLSVSSFQNGTLSLGDGISAAAGGGNLIPGTVLESCVSGSSFNASISGTIMSVSNVNSGNISIGDTIEGPGISGACTVTAIGSDATGGGAGTYGMTVNNSVISEGLLALSSGSAQFAVSISQTVASTTLASANGTFTGSIAGTVMSVTGLSLGTISNGDTLTTGATAGTTITSNLSGASFIGSMSAQNMYVDSVLSGTLATAQRVVGPGVSNATTISSIGTAALVGGDGNYGLSSSHNVPLTGLMSFTGGAATYTLNQGQFAGNQALIGNQDYPAACSYFQQRAIYGGGNSSPDGLQTSRTGNYDNFNVSNPLRADDAISVNLVSNKVNAIRHFVSLTDLLAFTNDGCWKISGQTNGADVITPSNIIAVPQAVAGASLVPPIVVAPQIIYVQEKGNSVRELLYDVFRNMYTGTDRSILASHLFFGYTITDWAWAREPWKIVWAVRNDGTLLGFTYLPEQEVYAWHQHDTGQTTGGGCGTSTGQTGFLSVASVTETASTGQGLEDVVYLAVGRELQGGYQICIERMQSRVLGAGNDNITDAWFVDCGLQYSGAPVSRFQAPHLAGQTVAILADGCVKEQQQLDGFGYGALNQPASVITVGIPIQAQMETLPLDAGEPTIQGKYKRITKMRIYVDLTRGLKAGPMTNDGPVLEEIPSRSVEAWGTPPALFTGQQLVHVAGNWDTYGSLFVQQDYPLPATILGIEPWVQVGE